ncbi:hypothetical protein JW964_20860, partial [candidate division KSB1 bacterium]|nr:hypothetical protein [candidate division KSB1 bacterium]
EKYELGKISEDKFQKHLKTCPECQQLMAEDAKLMALAQELDQSVVAPHLWERIEADLIADKSIEKKNATRNPRTRVWYILRIAAVFLLIFGAGYLSRYFYESKEPKLLSDATIENIESREQDYIQAIAELEDQADSKMSQMDLDLMLLYRDRLETIDIQISRCKEELAHNPANAHIRRYLLTALQDKKATLMEILKFEMQG